MTSIGGVSGEVDESVLSADNGQGALAGEHGQKSAAPTEERARRRHADWKPAPSACLATKFSGVFSVYTVATDYLAGDDGCQGGRGIDSWVIASYRRAATGLMSPPSTCIRLAEEESYSGLSGVARRCNYVSRELTRTAL
jgi:hypothetical protein